MGSLPSTKLSGTEVDFIDDELLTQLLEQGPADAGKVRDIISKSLAKEALSTEETSVLLRAEAPELIEEIFEAARRLKETVYGNRIVLFAPLYIGSKCVNDCSYCGFRLSNPEAVRRSLSLEELRAQTMRLVERGHKRLILVWGEHPDYNPEFLADCVRTVYEAKNGTGEIRRVNINAAPLDVEGFRIVKEAGIGTYQIFQETYSRTSYARVHPPRTRKAGYLWRLDSLDRAMKAGIDDVGIGALFGLHDWRFEVLGLVSHALHLQEAYGVGPHTISFPRMQPASGVHIDATKLVSDDEFKRIVAILRLAVPYTGLILTARERPELRREVMAFGVSQIDAGSRIEIGAYTDSGESQETDSEQFRLGDIRSLDAVMHELITDGYLPSFCTACYRVGRTGEHFMEFAIPGFIKRFCTPNAISTLMEYLVDYASAETRAAGTHLVAGELERFENPKLKEKLVERLKRIEQTDARDLFF